MPLYTPRAREKFQTECKNNSAVSLASGALRQHVSPPLRRIEFHAAEQQRKLGRLELQSLRAWLMPRHFVTAAL